MSREPMAGKETKKKGQDISGMWGEMGNLASL